MRKFSTLDHLNAAWHKEKLAKHNRTYNGAGKPDAQRWQETVDAHHKKVSHCNRMKNRAKWVAGFLTEINFWGYAVRNSRKLAGMPKQITTFGNGGQAKSTRDDDGGDHA